MARGSSSERSSSQRVGRSVRSDRGATPWCVAVARRAVRAAVEAATSYAVDVAGPAVSPETDSSPPRPSSTITSCPPRTGSPWRVCWKRTTSRPATLLHARGPQVARGHAEHPADAVEMAPRRGDRRGRGGGPGACPGGGEQPDPAAVVPDQPDGLAVRRAVPRRGGLGRRGGTEQRADRADRQDGGQQPGATGGAVRHAGPPVDETATDRHGPSPEGY